MVFPGSLRHQVSVVGGGGVGHGSGAAAAEVAEVVGQHFQLVSRELAIIPENLTMIIINTKPQTNTVISYLVVTGPAGALDTLVRHQVEIPLGRMVDALVHHSPGQSVPVLVFVVISGEKPSNKLLFCFRFFTLE